MLRRFGVPVFIACTTLWAERVGAETMPISLAVHRGPDAERCPDHEAIENEIRTAFPEVAVHVVADPAESVLRADIAIAAIPRGYEATIAFSGTRTGQRRIADESEDCGGLAKALTIAVALMADVAGEPSTLERQTAPAPGELPPRKNVATDAPEGQHAPGRAARLRRAVVEPTPVEAGGVVGVGAFQDLSYGGYFGAGLVVARWLAFRARALSLASRSQRQGGAVDVSVVGGVLTGCARVQASDHFWILPCAGVGLGSQRGTAKGYDHNWSNSSPWRTVGGGLWAEAALHSQVRVMLGVELLAALHRQTYWVTEVGPIQRQPPLGTYLWLGIAPWPLLDRNRQEF